MKQKIRPREIEEEKTPAGPGNRTPPVQPFDLKVKFNMAIEDRANTGEATRRKVEDKVLQWIEIAEDLFDRAPALRITPIWNWNVPRDGLLRDNTLEFTTNKAYHKWVDQNFDNVVGDHKTEGHFQVLLLDSFSLKTDGAAGAAFLPQRICGRKHGIVMEFPVDGYLNRRAGGIQYRSEGILAHEFGHTFSLRHTFEAGRCNRAYPIKGDDGENTTRRSDGTVNVMDYWLPQPVTGFYLNDLQAEKAANQRKRYMTTGGEVNYRALKRNG